MTNTKRSTSLRGKSVLYQSEQDGIAMDFLAAGNTLIEAKYNKDMTGEQLRIFQSHPAWQKHFSNSEVGLSIIDKIQES